MNFDNIHDLETWMAYFDPCPIAASGIQASHAAQAIMLAATKPVETTRATKINAKHISSEDKLKIRREQSRVSSQRYRAKRKADYSELEKAYAELKSKHALLEAENEDLRRQLVSKKAAETA